jgi:hypothetical protein
MKLNKLLVNKREIAEEKFLLAGEGLPKIPIWAHEGKAREYWVPNDFEILGACYRRDVETFLTLLADNLEFLKTKNDPIGEQHQTCSPPEYSHAKSQRNKEHGQELTSKQDNDPEYVSYFPRQSQSNRMRSAAAAGKHPPPPTHGQPTQHNASRRMRDLFPENSEHESREVPPHFK